METLLDGLAALGAALTTVVAGAGRLLRFLALVARHGAFPPRQALVQQCWLLVRRCLLPVAFVVVPMGALISLHGAAMIQAFGAERLLAPLVALVVVRELAPGFAAMMVAMQAGTSVTAEVAVMRIREELDAYEVLAVDPLRHVVAPRLWAGLLMAPLLCVLAMGLAVMGAFMVAVAWRGFAARAFVEGCLSAVTPYDLTAALIKSMVFGLLLGGLCCYEGWHAHGGAAGVGRAANRSVVGAILGILFANYVLNSVLYAGVAAVVL